MTKKTETRPATGHINPFGLRMQLELREKLESAAEANGRSLNAEIVDRLEASLRRLRVDEQVAMVVDANRGLRMELQRMTGWIKDNERAIAAMQEKLVQQQETKIGGDA